MDTVAQLTVPLIPNGQLTISFIQNGQSGGFGDVKPALHGFPHTFPAYSRYYRRIPKCKWRIPKRK